MLNYRSTAHSATEISPAEALMGRQLKTRLPILPTNLKPKLTDHEKIVKADAKTKERYKLQYDRKHGAKPLSELHPGQSVLIRLPTDNKWEKGGTVVLADPENRLYHIATETGVVRRNRLHLQPAPGKVLKI